uniref:Uncharacterized protein n=1 Tax=Sorangium cellulosum TaxID=56 RepID=A0A3S5GYE4_SORCE|nr:hypothetical protein [Sorangium cellulosum]
MGHMPRCRWRPHGNVDFGGGVLRAGNVLIKLDANGEHLFSRPFRSVISTVGDPDGNLLVAAGPLSKPDVSGTELWTTLFATPGVSLSLSPLGTIGLTGTTRGRWTSAPARSPTQGPRISSSRRSAPEARRVAWRARAEHAGRLGGRPGPRRANRRGAARASMVCGNTRRRRPPWISR